ncbi:MAG TPA: ABC transporter permease [Propionibacteriaceae bacterium]
MSVPTAARADDQSNQLAAPSGKAPRRRGSVGAQLRGSSPWVLLQRYGALLALILLLVYNALATESFTLENFVNTPLRQAVPVAIVAIGMALVIGTGGIDLSVGSVMAITAQVGVILLLAGVPALAAMALAVLVGALCGAFNGALVARFGIQPIIATLVLFIGGRGVAKVLSSLADDKPSGALLNFRDDTFSFLGLSKMRFFQPGGGVFAIPVQVLVLVVVAVVAAFVVRKTGYGRYLLATGGNEQASRLAGIAVGRVKVLAYVTCSALAGLTGVIMAGNNGASNPATLGLNMELDAIAAVAVAGTPLTGGRITIWGTVVGAVMLQLLRFTLISHGSSQQVAQMIQGLVIVAALCIQRPGRSR